MLPSPPLPSRRKFLRRVGKVGLGLLAATGATVGYGFYEASQIRIRRQTISVPHLPNSFDGIVVGVLTDLHHGPFVSLEFIRKTVALANSLKPDLFALLGDFAHKGTHTHEQLPPCVSELSRLTAPLGVFAVPGNHDMGQRGTIYREVLAEYPQLVNLQNQATPVMRQGECLWMAGVDELWWGKPDLEATLKHIPPNSATILLCHNPDFAELSPDPRVGLMLSGHTHGGQAYVPGYGPLWLPSRFGSKYCHGLVQGPASRVFVSRGLGEAGVPLRLNCPPEINLLTLTPA